MYYVFMVRRLFLLSTACGAMVANICTEWFGVVPTLSVILGADRRYDPFVEVEILDFQDVPFTGRNIVGSENCDEIEGIQLMQSTPVHRNAASDVEWADLSMSIEIPLCNLKKPTAVICLRAMDYAEGKRKIKFLCQSLSVDKSLVLSHVGHWMDVEGAMIDERNRLAGKYAMKIRYAPKQKKVVEYGNFDLCQVVVTHIKPTGAQSCIFHFFRKEGCPLL